MQNSTIKAEQAYTTIMILWFSQVISQVVMAFIIWYVKPELYQFDFTRPIVDRNFTIVAVLGLLAVALFAGSFVLRKMYLLQSVVNQKVALVQTAVLVGCALCEATTLFGVLLGLSFNYAYFFLFIAFGIFATLLHFPRRNDVYAAGFKAGI